MTASADDSRAEARADRGPEARGGTASRQAVVAAAIDCILERGFYRASSNAIAERAGVTWGAIQHHFGTREALMLAVLEEGTERLRTLLQDARLTGDTVVDRVGEYADVLESYYGSQEYLAFMQVVLNLAHDPRTTAQTTAAMQRVNDSVDADLHRLAGQVLRGSGVTDPAYERLLFHALRGLAISHVMITSNPPTYGAGRQAEFARSRTLLVEAVGLLIRQASSR